MNKFMKCAALVTMMSLAGGGGQAAARADFVLQFDNFESVTCVEEFEDVPRYEKIGQFLNLNPLGPRCLFMHDSKCPPNLEALLMALEKLFLILGLEGIFPLLMVQFRATRPFRTTPFAGTIFEMVHDHTIPCRVVICCPDDARYDLAFEEEFYEAIETLGTDLGMEHDITARINLY
ncbi:MAG: hypothetical protein LBJ92_03170 [Holosporales bacterium]|jgi:hypothetical protein|nr:hypothetical protein [Holosporales bacterium]